MRRLTDLMSLEGRVAVVTGGTGHLGLAFCEALAELGARVVVVDREPASCAARAASLSDHSGNQAVGLAADLSSRAETATVVPRVLEAFGRLDILINNAAFTGASGIAGFAVPFAEQSLDAWDAALRVNLTAAFQLTQAAREPLMASGHGSVINIGSIYGLVGPDLRLYEGTSMGNPAAYAASKGGLIQLTRYLSTSLAPKVRVNSISPGGIARGQAPAFVERYLARTPMQRMGTEEDFKGAVAYLASDLSAWVTGQDVAVEGGWTAW